MARCLTPLIIQVKTTGQYIPVPCGKCPPCLSRRVSGWSFRLMQEFKVSRVGYFVTLTYNTDCVPISDKGFMTLNIRDVQLMMKRLRKARGSNPEKVKYYYCGEYGSKSERPHYHLIIFNVEPAEIIQAWSYVKDGKRLAFGNVHFGEVSAASVGYTLKYMSKPKRYPRFAGDDRVKEFSAMSKGIGLSYLTDAMRRWHEADLLGRVYVPLTDGKKAPLPRYFRNRIYSEADLEMIGAHFASLESAKAGLSESETWDKLQSDVASFARMYERSLAGRDTI